MADCQPSAVPIVLGCCPPEGDFARTFVIGFLLGFKAFTSQQSLFEKATRYLTSLVERIYDSGESRSQVSHAPAWSIYVTQDDPGFFPSQGAYNARAAVDGGLVFEVLQSRTDTLEVIDLYDRNNVHVGIDRTTLSSPHSINAVNAEVNSFVDTAAFPPLGPIPLVGNPTFHYSDLVFIHDVFDNATSGPQFKTGIGSPIFANPTDQRQDGLGAWSFFAHDMQIFNYPNGAEAIQKNKFKLRVPHAYCITKARLAPRTNGPEVRQFTDCFFDPGGSTSFIVQKPDTDLPLGTTPGGVVYPILGIDAWPIQDDNTYLIGERYDIVGFFGACCVVPPP
jgi:hypothetical protein